MITIKISSICYSFRYQFAKQNVLMVQSRCSIAAIKGWEKISSVIFDPAFLLCNLYFVGLPVGL